VTDTLISISSPELPEVIMILKSLLVGLDQTSFNDIPQSLRECTENEDYSKKEFWEIAKRTKSGSLAFRISKDSPS